MNLQFVKVERDCPANTKTRKDRAGDHLIARHLIWDFNVIIDGEHRATWKSQRWAARDDKYELCDIDGRNIRVQVGSSSQHDQRSIRCGSQAVFEDKVRQHIDLIPTREQLEAQRTRDAGAAAARDADARRRVRDEHIRNMGQRLLEVLQEIDEHGLTADTREQMEAALAMAERV